MNTYASASRALRVFFMTQGDRVMRRYAARFSLLACALMLFGAGAAVADPSVRPFKGTVVGEATFPSAEFCVPIPVQTVSTAAGTFSHLGRTTMSSRHCAPPADEITGGETTLVAANGDQLFITYGGVLTFDPEVIEFNGEFQIVGGTGRFDGATGGGAMTGFIVFEGILDPAWPGTWIFEGTIRY